jgi:hypothetical protein
MLLSKYKKEIEETIANWFQNHPSQKEILDTFVAENNIDKNQSLGMIILKMPEEIREGFSGLIKTFAGVSAKILFKEGLL